MPFHRHLVDWRAQRMKSARCAMKILNTSHFFSDFTPFLTFTRWISPALGGGCSVQQWRVRALPKWYEVKPLRGDVCAHGGGFPCFGVLNFRMDACQWCFGAPRDFAMQWQSSMESLGVRGHHRSCPFQDLGCQSTPKWRNFAPLAPSLRSRNLRNAARSDRRR